MRKRGNRASAFVGVAIVVFVALLYIMIGNAHAQLTDVPGNLRSEVEGSTVKLTWDTSSGQTYLYDVTRVAAVGGGDVVVAENLQATTVMEERVPDGTWAYTVYVKSDRTTYTGRLATIEVTVPPTATPAEVAETKDEDLSSLDSWILGAVAGVAGLVIVALVIRDGWRRRAPW